LCHEKNTPTAGHVADLRRDLPKQFPRCSSSSGSRHRRQVLNFGSPAHRYQDFRTGTDFSFGLASKSPRI
jgi:hypothetical protein